MTEILYRFTGYKDDYPHRHLDHRVGKVGRLTVGNVDSKYPYDFNFLDSSEHTVFLQVGEFEPVDYKPIGEREYL